MHFALHGNADDKTGRANHRCIRLPLTTAVPSRGCHRFPSVGSFWSCFQYPINRWFNVWPPFSRESKTTNNCHFVNESKWASLVTDSTILDQVHNQIWLHIFNFGKKEVRHTSAHVDWGLLKLFHQHFCTQLATGKSNSIELNRSHQRNSS